MACGASARCRASRRSLTQRHRIYNRLNCLRHTAAKTIRTGGMAMEGGAGYNAAADLIERNLVAGRGAKPAFIDEGGAYSYAELAERVGRFANTVRQLGGQPHPEEPCFGMYSSGSPGGPKGTVHLHSSLVQTADLYAIPVLGIGEDDVSFSAAKLFFAYGLGNGLTFPLAVGATSVLLAGRPTPDSLGEKLP